MSLGLSLLPIEDSGTVGWAHTVLDFPLGRVAFVLLADVDRMPVPERFNSFMSRGADGEYRYGEMRTIPSGDGLMCVFAGDLVRALDAVTYRARDLDVAPDVAATIPLGWRWRACLAFLRELPPHTKVALFWK